MSILSTLLSKEILDTEEVSTLKIESKEHLDHVSKEVKDMVDSIEEALTVSD